MKRDLEDDLAEDPTLVEKAIDEAPESQRWDPIPGSVGERILPLHGDEEDEEGLPPGAKLVETGVEAAEFDQMLQSDQATSEEDEEEFPDEELADKKVSHDIDLFVEDEEEP